MFSKMQLKINSSSHWCLNDCYREARSMLTSQTDSHIGLQFLLHLGRCSNYGSLADKHDIRDSDLRTSQFFTLT
jgi:hypothetical protein